MERAPRRIGLGLKAVLVLLAVALAPLVAAVVLIDQVAVVAQNFASNQAERLMPSLDGAAAAYRDLIATKKRLYRQVAERAAALLADPRATPPPRSDPPPAALPELRALLGEEPDLLSITVERDGAITYQVMRDLTLGGLPARHRPLEVPARAADGRIVKLVFAADLDVAARYQSLGRVLADARQVDSMKTALPRSYRTAFLAVLGGVVLIASATGVLLARRLTGRIDQLVEGTRQVARGDLATRVAIRGRDELGELGAAFDRMVEELAHDREQILYLQRMSAWQDMARRLAHEIKNPLTPIQLAVQQLHSSYRGDDERHRKMLGEALEIVTEEIAGLRRLVDAFRELGRLPEVDPQPLDLAVVLDDLRRELAFADRLVVEPPPAPVVVAGDRLLLRRVVANLVENGIHAGQAAGKDGRVLVGWSQSAGRARLTVDDEGAGVPAGDRERIFEPYVTGKEGGTGLGLAIARKLALDHGGDLALAPEPAPSGGARFVVTLPTG